MKKFLTFLLTTVICLTLSMAIGCDKTEETSKDYEVTAEEYAIALSLANESNYKVTTNNTVVSSDETQVMTMVVERDGDKLKLVLTDVETEIGYTEKVGDKYYSYSEVDGSFVKRETTKTLFDMYANVFANIGIEYDDLTYNAETKAYEAVTVEVDVNNVYTDVSIKFEDNKLVSLTAKIAYGQDADSTQIATVSYGGVSVTVPTVE